MAETATGQREPDPRTIWRELHGRGDPSGENGLVALHILHGDVDLVYGQSRRDPYRLDEHARDTLLAHARQDAAHAVLNTGSILSELAALRSQVRALIVLVGLLVIGVPGVLVLTAWALGFMR